MEKIIQFSFEPGDAVFCNGWQSWSCSREFRRGERQTGLGWLGKLVPRFAKVSGDYDFTKYKKGLFQSSMYGYVRRGDYYFLFGSKSDDNGFTTLYYDMPGNRIIVDKEGDAEPDMLVFEGAQDEVFDAYFSTFNTSKMQKPRLTGYTSWYNNFTKITQSQILEDLQGMDRVKGHANIFQIDDGWQKDIGVWHECNEKFPSGMKCMADAIHQKGLLAGLWLAPFAVQRKSETAKAHPDWLIYDAKGRPVICSVAWGGAYTLDVLNPEVRAYIKTAFDTVLGEWGFDMVKLDFLYGVCSVPRQGKTRGEIMAYAMDFLRECAGDKIILGCGVPLTSAIGRVNACRIGCDADIQYAPRFFNNLNREIISTTNAINNAITRAHLDKRVFSHDPDVFFLRQRGDKLRYSMRQKRTLAKINKWTGSVLFVSDNMAKYDDEALEIAKEVFDNPSGERLVKYTTIDRWNYEIHTNLAKYKLNLKKGVLTRCDGTENTQRSTD